MITPFQALCLAERCALLSGRDIDFVMNVFAAWTGRPLGRAAGRRGMGRRGLPAPAHRGRHLDLRRGLAAARTRRRGPQGTTEGRLLPGARPAALPRRPHALGHGQPPAFVPLPAGRRPAQPARAMTRPRRTTCSSAPRAATPAAPTTPTTSSPQPPKACTRPARASGGRSTSPPSRGPASRSARATGNKAADLADGTWPNLTGKFKPHDDRHSHATWLDDAELHKVIQMDRRGHAMHGMDRVYMHVTRHAPATLRRPRRAMAGRSRTALRASATVSRACPEQHPDRLRTSPARQGHPSLIQAAADVAQILQQLPVVSLPWDTATVP